MMRLNIVLHNTTDIDTHLEVLNASSLDPCLISQEGPEWYLKKYRYKALTGNLFSDILSLSQDLSRHARTVWRVCSFLIEDESVFAFTGSCPVRVYIPRKPHPNGLLAYGQCTWTHVGPTMKKLPVLLDVEPYCTPGQNPGAHGSMMKFEQRFKEVRLSPFPSIPLSPLFGA